MRSFSQRKKIKITLIKDHKLFSKGIRFKRNEEIKLIKKNISLKANKAGHRDL